MRLRHTLLSAAVLAVLPASAGAHVPHHVTTGETLSGIAAANGLSTAALAAANGMSPDAFVIEGTTIQIPPAGAVTAPAPASTPVTGGAAPAPLGGYRVRLGDTLSGIAARHGVSLEALAAANGLDPANVLLNGTTLRLPGSGSSGTAIAPTSSTSTTTASGTAGGHLVTPGETLTGIAAANGISPSALAAANGLRPDSFVIAGSRLKIPAASGTAVTSSSGSAATPVAGAPSSSGGSRLDAGTISSIASQHGVPGSLAAAIAWQESGFNNNMVSVANARGIMQVIPSSWDFVQRNLGAGPLDPNNPADNVKAGSVLLNHLLQQTGDETTAIAAYYQGLGSVRKIGLLPETQRYVANVQALRGRFGG